MQIWHRAQRSWLNNLKSVVLLKICFLLSCFDGGYAYLRQQMLVVCRLHKIFHFTNMTLSKRSRSHTLKNLSTA